MASINFIYRSTKDKANLNIRFLYRNPNISSIVKSKKTGEKEKVPYTDFVLGAKTKIEVSKTYWTKQHKKNLKILRLQISKLK
jgi:hypothetical protein